MNTFGELLSMDPLTISRRRMNYARICVGVYQGTYMPKSIFLKSKLGGWTQHIKYESYPSPIFIVRNLVIGPKNVLP